MLTERSPVIDELVRDGMEAAVKARDLLWKYTTLQIEKEELLEELQSIRAKEILFSNWGDFQHNEAISPCLEIFQVVYSISEDIDYQLQYYGLDSLREDIKQLDASMKILKRYLEKHNNNTSPCH